MKISENYLENINYLVTNLIPLKICQYCSFLPVSFEKNSQDNKLSSVAIVMVNPHHIYACDTLDKLLAPKKIKYQKLLISPLDYQRLLRLYSRYLEDLKIATQLNNYSPHVTLNSSSYNNLAKLNNNKQAKKNNLLTPKKDDLVLGNRQKKLQSLNLGVLGGKEGLLIALKSNNLTYIQRAKLNNVNFQGTQIDQHTKLPPKSLLIWKIVNQGLCGNYQLRELKLSLANLNTAKISEVDFSYSTFDRVDLSQSNLSQVNFQESELTEVNFQESKLIDINFSKSHLKQVNFLKAKLTGVDFKEVIFEQVVFSEVTMINVDMSYLDLSNLNLNFSSLDLRESKFIRTNLAGINLTSANLSKVNLSGANLCNVNLNNANLNDVKLTLATYNRSTKFPDDFNPQRFGAIFIDS